MLPRFEIVHRARPISLVGREHASDFVAPYAAVEVDLAGDADDRVTFGFTGPGLVRLEAWYGGSGLGLEVTDAEGRVSRHRSRRRGRPETAPTSVAAALTGAWLTVLSLEDGDWVARGRVDLRGIVETRTREFAASIKAHAEGRVTAWRSGTFGQVGLRDVHLVTHADGTPYEDDGLLMLTMSHAGPGFFDTGHTGVWSFDPATYEIQHRADVWFERDGMVLGDHGSHLVRDGGRWLLATSTWGDFGRRPRTRITLSVTDADLLSGEHVLASEPLPLPEAELPTRCAGTWDPHLAMVDGHWHVAFVAARKYFSFYPALARGARPGELDGFELLGASPGRRATEGTVMARLDGEWRVLASDGRDNPPWCRGGFPVFDLGMRELGTLDAPYLTNIPWPSVVPSGDGWLLLTFDGTRAGGDLAGYGTHGDFVVMRSG